MIKTYGLYVSWCQCSGKLVFITFNFTGFKWTKLIYFRVPLTIGKEIWRIKISI